MEPMGTTENEILEQLDRHLASPQQQWLLGAGISKDAGIPLMGPLTERIFSMLPTEVDERQYSVLCALREQLAEGTNIEDLLSQIADYRALASRSKDGTLSFHNADISQDDLVSLHTSILSAIRRTIRWGYFPTSQEHTERIGTKNEPVVDVNDHLAFVRVLFETAQAGLQNRRGPVRFFTTNYDTLLEDALALSRISYWDGFIGGAIAFRSHQFGEEEPSQSVRAHIHKLHGSIDWYLGDDGYVYRVRDDDRYPTRDSKEGRVLIYPQATKYVATQRDPFASQFDLFRRTLSTTKDNVLLVCGYSFGDGHLNEEIELCLSKPHNKTTMIVFSSGHNGLPQPLKEWLKTDWGQRIFVVTKNGIYAGRDGPFYAPSEGEEWHWWTFQGAIDLLKNGPAGG